jgi:Asp-tRNA(Asn)/Glu-tRNA(Gln) amidotransferase A subunit family amidase
MLEGFKMLIGITGTGLDRSIYLGTPLCVQVVAPKLQEEKLVAAMTAIDSALKTRDQVAAKL